MDNKLISAIAKLLDSSEFEEAVSVLAELNITHLTARQRRQVYSAINRLSEEQVSEQPRLCCNAARLAYGSGDAARGRYWQNRLIAMRDVSGEATGQGLLLEACVYCAGLAAPGNDNAQVLMTLAILDSEFSGKHVPSILLSATYGRPSVLRGAKDLSDWGKNFRAVRRIVRPLLGTLLEDGGQGACEAAVSELLYEKNDLVAAASEAAIAASAQNPEIAFAGLAQLARINRFDPQARTPEEILRQLEGLLEDREAEWLLENYWALTARLDLEAGRHEQVRKWLDDCALKDNDVFFVEDSYEQITRAKAYLVLGQPQAAANLLEKAVAVLKMELRPLDLIECLINNAIACELLGKSETAAGLLEQAVELALPYGYIRVFADCGAPLYMLMCRYVKSHAKAGPTAKRYFSCILENAKRFGELCPTMYQQGLAWAESAEGKSTSAFASQLVDAVESAEPEEQSDEESVYTSLSNELPEKLTQTEMAVLTLVSKGKSNDDISAEMDIKLSTVKFHVANIMGKLGAKNRTEAVSLALKNGVTNVEDDSEETKEVLSNKA